MGYITLMPNDPLIWNFIFGVVVAIVYVQGIILLMEKMVNSGQLSSDLSRKVIHIAAGSFIWTWLFIDTSDGVTYLFNIAVPLLFFINWPIKKPINFLSPPLKRSYSEGFSLNTS